MTSQARKPSIFQTWGLALACGSLLVVVLTVWGAGAAGDAVNGTAVEANPFGYVIKLLTGRRSWPGWLSTLIIAVLLALVLAAAVLLVIRAARRARRPKTVLQVDEAARRMGRAKDLRVLMPAGVAQSAQRLRARTVIDPRAPEQHGRLLGLTVAEDVPVRANWELLGAHIWGPRTGKTTSLTIPQSTEAPGALVATSNKRDLVDATRGPRSRHGHVWIFDPQQVATEPPKFWYNPLSRIADISSASIVAGHFVTGTRDPDARTDSYFDGSAEELLAAYLLAAALAGGTLTDVYMWLTDDKQKKPARILDQHGQTLVARDVTSLLEAPEKQRKGVFDTSKKLLACLRNQEVLEWVSPPSDGRPEFKPADFVASTDSMYLLSMEQRGSAGPLVASLTEHICEEATRRATRMPGGRLDPPLLVQLDEAANVCKWRELPGLYSHFGSRGILIDVILQSWAQGEEVWGKGGMKKLWGAANIRTYGGGAVDGQFLHELMQLAGKDDYEHWTRSINHIGQNSFSDNGREKDRLPMDVLAAMPPGRALVLASGCPAFIVKPVPWMLGPHAEEINQSIKTYDPGAAA